MLLRGYDEDSSTVDFFTTPVSRGDRRILVAGILFIIAFVCLDFFLPKGTLTWN